VRSSAVWSILTLACGLELLGWVGGCGHDADNPTVSEAGAVFPIIGTTEAGAGSACASCRASTCAAQLLACKGAADCARYLACAQTCPVDALGAPQNDCEQSCAASETSDSGENPVIRELQICESSARCAACLAPFDAGYIDANACGSSYSDGGDPACLQCLASRCCTEYRACDELDGGCGAATSCFVDCVNDAGTSCVEDCNAALPESMGTDLEQLICATNRCSAECTTGTLTACEKCTDPACPPQAAAVIASTEASLLYFCRAECGTDATCQSACDQKHPTGVSAVNSLNACQVLSCKTICQ